MTTAVLADIAYLLCMLLFLQHEAISAHSPLKLKTSDSHLFLCDKQHEVDRGKLVTVTYFYVTSNTKLIEEKGSGKRGQEPFLMCPLFLLSPLAQPLPKGIAQSVLRETRDIHHIYFRSSAGCSGKLP
jgi:hypothetical protein